MAKALAVMMIKAQIYISVIIVGVEDSTTNTLATKSVS
jgi:hypothetical protein